MDKSRCIKILLLVVFYAGTTSTDPINESDFLRALTSNYSPLLVVSFLKTRINYQKEMIEKIKNVTIDMDQPRRDLFDLSAKIHDILLNQLITLEDADHFAVDGKEKVNYFIEQFIAQNKLYPVGFGSYGVVKVPLTPDDLLARLASSSRLEMIKETTALVRTYLADIESKESAVSNNIIQKLSIALTKTKLKSLIDYNYGVTEGSKSDIEANIKKLKTITDFFYSQYGQLSNEVISN